MSNSDVSPIDTIIREIKSLILPNMIKKRSNHTHPTPEPNCNLCLIMDRNWLVLNAFSDTLSSTPLNLAKFEPVVV